MIAFHYNQASNLSQSLPFLGGGVANTMLMEAGLSTQAIMGIGAVTGGGFDAAGQYVDTNGFTTGEWRPMQTGVATFTGGLLAPYAVNYGLFGNAMLGAGVSTTNAGFNNWYYNSDNSYVQRNLTGEAVKGAIGGYAGSYIGDFTTSYLASRLIYNTTLTYTARQMEGFSYYFGNTVGGSVSGAIPIIIDYSNQDKKK